MACTVTPKQVNEDVKGRLSETYPGLPINVSEQGYTYNMYEYVKELPEETISGLATAEELTMGTPGEVLTDKIRTGINTMFDSEIITVQDEVSTINASEDIASRLTAQNQKDENLAREISQKEDNDFATFYYKRPTATGRVKRFFNMKSSSKNRVRTYKLLSGGNSTIDSSTVLNRIARGHHPLRNLASHLLEISKDSPVDIIFVNGALKGVRSDTGETLMAAGQYSADTNSIRINLDSANDPESLLLHEMIHALTYHVIETQGHTKEVQALMGYYAMVKDAPGIKGKYAVSNIHEFITHLYTDPQFRRALKKIPSDSYNYTGGIKDVLMDLLTSIYKLLGLTYENNLLNEAIFAANEVLNLPGVTNDELGNVVSQEFYDSLENTIPLYAQEKRKSARAALTEFLRGLGNDFVDSTVKTLTPPKKIVKKNIPLEKEWAPKGLKAKLASGEITKEFYFNIVNNLTKMRNAHAEIQLVDSYDKNGNPQSQYYDHATGTFYRRVSNVVHDEEIKDSLLLNTASKHGNKFDVFVRDFYNGGLSDEQKKKDYFGNASYYDDFYASLLQFDQELKDRGEEVVPGEILLHDPVTKVAGTVDIMTVDANGTFRIYDLKTMRGVGTNFGVDNDGYTKYTRPGKWINGQQSTTIDADSKAMKHQKQLSLYSFILERTYGFRATDLTIVPIEIDYAKPKDQKELENSKVTNAAMMEPIPFKRVAAIKNILQPKNSEERKRMTAPMDNSTAALTKYLQGSVEELYQRVREYNALIRNTKDPKLKKEYEKKRNQIQLVYDDASRSYYKLRREGQSEFFTALTKEVTQLQSFLQNGLMDPYLQDRIFFLNKFITGEKHDRDRTNDELPVNIASLRNYDVPEYQALLTTFTNLKQDYFGTGIGENRTPGYIDNKVNEIITTDILIANNVMSNPKLILSLALGMSDEDIENLPEQTRDALVEEHGPAILKKIQDTPDDTKQGLFSTNFLSLGYSMGADSVLPQLIKSAYNTAIEVAQSKFKKNIDAIKQVEVKLKKAGITDMSFLFEKTPGGQVTNRLNTVIDNIWLQQNVFQVVFRTNMNSVFTPKQKAEFNYNTIKNNTEAIDPRMLSAIRNDFSATHGYMFNNVTDAQIQAYEDRLRHILGPGYDAVVEDAHGKFSQAISQMEHIGIYNTDFNSMYAKLQIDPVIAIDLLNQDSTNPAFTFGAPIPGSTGKAYPDFRYVTLIPKMNKDGTRGQGYNHDFIESFQNDPNSALKEEAWKAFTEAYQQVAFTYRNYDVLPSAVSRNYKSKKELFDTAKFDKAAKTISGSSPTLGILKVASSIAKDMKKASFTAQKGDESVKKEVSSNYADIYDTYRKSLIGTLKFSSVRDLQAAYTDLTGKQTSTTDRGQLLTEVSFALANMAFSDDIFTSTQETLKSAIMQEARQDTLPKANLITEVYRNLSNRTPGEKNWRKLYDKNQQAVDKLEDFIDRQLYGIGEVELDSKGNIKKKNSWRTKAKEGRRTVSFFSDMRKHPSNPVQKKIGDLYTNAVNAGFLPSKVLAFMSDREKVLFQHLDTLLQKGLGKDATVSFKVGELTYRRTRVVVNKQVIFKDFRDEGGSSIEITEGEMDMAFEAYILQRMDDLGLSVTLSGVVDGALSYLRFIGLAFSPVSGAFNRLDGKISNYILNSSGKYWNNPDANKNTNNFLFGYNSWRFAGKSVGGVVDRDRDQQYEILTYLVDNANVLQSTANGDEGSNRHTMSTGDNFWKTLLGMYSYSVDLPEGKNQVTPLLNIMQETYITKSDGTQVPLFDGEKFPAWDLVDGVIKLKPEFRVTEQGNENTSNISNWENFEPNIENPTDNAYTLMRRRVIEAIEAGQGDYSQFNNIKITRTYVGRAVSLMFKWAFMQHRLWWGKGGGVNITRGVVEEKGFARGVTNSPLVGGAALAGFIGVQTGMSVATVLGGGGFVLAGLAAYGVYRQMKKSNSTVSEVLRKNMQLSASLAYETVMETGNIALHGAYVKKDFSNIGILSKFSKGLIKPATREEAMGIKATAANLAIVTHATMLPIVVQLLFGLWVEDDEPDSFGRMLHNFIANSTDRVASSSTMMMSPVAILKQVQELYVLSLVDDVATGMASPDIGKGASKLGKRLLPKPAKLAWETVSPSEPGMYNPLKTVIPVLDYHEYVKGTWTDHYIRDMATDGEYSAERERLSEVRQLKARISQEKKATWDWFLNSESQKDALEEELKRVPKKGRGRNAQTQKEALEALRESDIYKEYMD